MLGIQAQVIVLMQQDLSETFSQPYSYFEIGSHTPDLPASISQSAQITGVQITLKPVLRCAWDGT